MPAPTSPVEPDALPELPEVARRFCRYARIHTTSDPDAAAIPSTPQQADLSRLLVEELRALGVGDAALDDAGVVYASLPGTAPNVARVGLVAHVDTSPDAPGENVRPLIHPAYAGGRVTLPADPAARLDPETHPELTEALGHDLITSDGSTLLGSDDKAGVAVIMQVVADLLRAEREATAAGRPPPARPALRILFTPDEEIGRGTDHVDLDRFGAEVAYTLDGSGVDQLNVETFNAAEARVRIAGVGVHPGYAKGVLVNALRIGAAFVAALPADAAPETTDGTEGYLHPHTLTGTAEAAELRLLLRDFTDEGMAAQRALVAEIAERLRAAHPRAGIQVEITESYRNMRRDIEAVDPRALRVALDAARNAGIEMALEPIRGGTDGARLSALGLPTPNVFTGGHAFHSRFEWNTVQNLERALRYTHALVAAWAREPSRADA
jgi:tripeptide aminopeptidase